ncbi:MAG: competence/damage-inducible protein A [Deltaproteobacteria bacterium]|nr:competence/damage-inducible protein A [Deltaproteobacteria bacterium]
MYGEIITIGNELTSGRTPDLNSWYAAGKLTASGLSVLRITSVGDDEKMAADALKRASAASKFVIVTGGLGSTEDDMTCKIAADALDRPLCLDHQMLQKIKNYVKAKGIAMTPPLEKMAFMPEGAKMIHPKGAACGFSLVENDIRYYFLPGVPDEMRYIMDAFVLPELLSLYERPPVMRQRLMKLYGLDEPGIAEIFTKLERTSKDAVFGFYPHFPENHITISLRGKDEPAVTAALDKIEREIISLVGPYVFATGNQEMEEVVGRLLVERKKTLSVAESCTGGLIGHRLTNVSGSSSYFQGGVVSYSNQSKADMLHVDSETIQKHGAVSAETAEEMARGIRERMKADMGVAVTGIAGPEGGSREKPVGTVYIGLDSPNAIFSRRYRFWGRRKQVKLNTSMMALDWVRRFLNGDPFLPGV